MSAIQKNIGIIPDCKNVKIGKAGTGYIMFSNDLGTQFSLAYPGGSVSGNFGSGSVGKSSGLFTYTNTKKMMSKFRLNATTVRDPTLSSHIPICGITNQCNISPVYNTSSTTFTVKHFNNNATAYRYNTDGQYYKIRQNLNTNAVLGTYYQFTVSAADFIIVDDALSSNQYHLSIIHGGFYDFNEFVPCLNQLPNIRNLALEPILVASTSLKTIASTTNIVLTTDVIETTIVSTLFTEQQTTLASTVEDLQTTLSSTYYTEIASESLEGISKRRRAILSTSVYDSYSLDTTTTFTMGNTTIETISLSQEYVNGHSSFFLAMSLQIFLREFVSFNFFLIVMFALYKKIKVWIQKKRKEKARMSSSSK